MTIESQSERKRQYDKSNITATMRPRARIYGWRQRRHQLTDYVMNFKGRNRKTNAPHTQQMMTAGVTRRIKNHIQHRAASKRASGRPNICAVESHNSMRWR